MQRLFFPCLSRFLVTPVVAMLADTCLIAIHVPKSPTKIINKDSVPIEFISRPQVTRFVLLMHH